MALDRDDLCVRIEVVRLKSIKSRALVEGVGVFAIICFGRGNAEFKKI